MVQSVKNEFGDMTDCKTGYGKIDLGTSNRITENEDCILELVTAEGASSRFLLNEIVGRYRTCILLIFCLCLLSISSSFQLLLKLSLY